MRRIVLAAALLLTAIPAANAEQYVVAEARGVSLPVGSVIDPTRPLILRMGQHLTLISESGRTIRIDGPYQSAPASDQGLQVASAVGGLLSHGGRQTLGTTRAAPKGPPLPQPWLIDATASGSACLQQGQAPVLWRPEAGAAADVVIYPADRSWRAETTWPAHANVLTLGKDLGVHGDASYFVSVGPVKVDRSQSDVPEQAITIATVPSVLTTDPMRAAWMMQKGCDRQADALLPRAPTQ